MFKEREVYDGLEQTFQLVGKNFDLCYESELFLFDDIKSERVCLVNDTFLMKTTGVPAGIAIREVLVKEGKIQLGFWYELSDHDDRYSITRMAWSGCKRIAIPGKSLWVEIRELRRHVGGRNISGDDLLKIAQTKSVEIKTNFSPRIMLK